MASPRASRDRAASAANGSSTEPIVANSSTIVHAKNTPKAASMSRASRTPSRVRAQNTPPGTNKLPTRKAPIAGISGPGAGTCHQKSPSRTTRRVSEAAQPGTNAKAPAASSVAQSVCFHHGRSTASWSSRTPVWRIHNETWAAASTKLTRPAHRTAMAGASTANTRFKDEYNPP